MSQDLETLQKLVEKISKKFPQVFSPEFADHSEQLNNFVDGILKAVEEIDHRRENLDILDDISLGHQSGLEVALMIIYNNLGLEYE